MSEFDALLDRLRSWHAGFFVADPAREDPTCLAWWIAGHDCYELDRSLFGDERI